MRRKITLLGTALAAGAVLAAFSLNTYGAQITEDDAKTIALDDAGFTEEEAVSIRVTPEREDGRELLEVSFFTADHEEYEYGILADSGLIYEASYDYETASGDAKETTLEQAMQIAAEHAGETADEVTFVKSETDRDDGRTVYELEFRTQEEKRFDYEIDADTGLILGWSYEAKDHLVWLESSQAQGEENVDSSSAKDPASGLEAARISALERAGLKEDEVTWGRVHEDFDDGRPVYEGKFFHGTDEYEFEVDAETGEIMEWDMESVFD